MERRTLVWILVAIAILIVICLVVACIAAFLFSVVIPARSSGPVSSPGPSSNYGSNGQQIYFTATSQRGTPIYSTMMGGMMMQGNLACVDCHGPDGQGGTVHMMGRTFDAPDIRYSVLTSGGDEGEVYTDEDIKRAITDGVDPNGDPLDFPMPRWTMSDADLDDLLTFLKTLK